MEKPLFEKSFLNEITEEKKIIEKLNNLKKENKNDEYIENLIMYYQILSPSSCQNYQINKTKTEKETFLK